MTILLRALVIMLGVQIITYAQVNNVMEIEPIPSVQLWIKQVVILETQEQVLKAISAFKQQEISTEKVIQQLIYFQVNAKQIYAGENLKDEDVSKRTMVANGIIALFLDWDAGTKKLAASSLQAIINAVAPYLDTDNPQLKKELYHTLMWVDQMQGAEKDFNQYEVYLKDKKNSPPAALVKYMFDRDPKVAVLSMSRIYGDKATEGQLADQLKDTPKTILQSLVDRHEWWAHLYVATMMEKEPYLRTPELMKKLEADTDPLVRAKISKLKDQIKPK
jgi:hypothetical protein